MSEGKKKALIRAGWGALMGLLIAGGFTLANGHGPKSFLGAEGAWATVIYFAYCALHGMVCMVTQAVYDVEKWSVTRATVTHFLITVSAFSLLMYLLGLFRPGDAAFWIMMAAFVAGYFIVWLIYYLRYKREIRRMNEDLKAWKAQKPPSD